MVDRLRTAVFVAWTEKSFFGVIRPTRLEIHFQITLAVVNQNSYRNIIIDLCKCGLNQRNRNLNRRIYFKRNFDRFQRFRKTHQILENQKYIEYSIFVMEQRVYLEPIFSNISESFDQQKDFELHSLKDTCLTGIQRYGALQY